jgi:hypothetical protein
LDEQYGEFFLVLKSPRSGSLYPSLLVIQFSALVKILPRVPSSLSGTIAVMTSPMIPLALLFLKGLKNVSSGRPVVVSALSRLLNNIESVWFLILLNASVNSCGTDVVEEDDKGEVLMIS